jgi:cephalosporin hydroxylase
MKIQQGAMAYRYRGVPLLKNPFDLALYPMLLERAKPRTLIEIGSFAGGSALWFADQAPGMRVLSVDLEPPAGVTHPSVTFLRGDARTLDGALPEELMQSLERPLLVVEDSNHLAGTTAAVLDFFDPWMRAGEYLVVEDGILTAMRAADSYEGGPLKAIREFLERTKGSYEVDRSLCDYFGTNVTWNVDGYLRRVSRGGAPPGGSQ